MPTTPARHPTPPPASVDPDDVAAANVDLSCAEGVEKASDAGAKRSVYFSWCSCGDGSQRERVEKLEREETAAAAHMD